MPKGIGYGKSGMKKAGKGGGSGKNMGQKRYAGISGRRMGRTGTKSK